MALTQPQEQSVIRLWRNPNNSVADIVKQLAEEFPGELTTLNRNKLIGLVARMREKGKDVPKRAQNERSQAISRAHRVRVGRPVSRRKRVKAKEPEVAFPAAPQYSRPAEKQQQKQNPKQKWSKYGSPLSSNQAPADGAVEKYVGAVTAKAKPLLELDAKECHFPLGDDRPQLYCAEPVVKGDYCIRHKR